jgi:hypothetical protein
MLVGIERPIPHQHHFPATGVRWIAFQHAPRAGSQSYPSPAAEANADGATTIYFGPSQPAGLKWGDWIQTISGKGWFTLLRLYSPLEPFFTKE